MADPLIPDLPKPWLFDGYRRLYDNGVPSGLWQARAIDFTSVEVEKETGRETASYQVGIGRDFESARDHLLGQIDLIVNRTEED